jgi:hypothetical protein
MLSKLERISLDGSLSIQAITLFINLFALEAPLLPSDIVLKEILGLETFVQIIELAFYGWYRHSLLQRVSDVTKFRYYDWFLTTPIMLFSTLCFYVYLEYELEKKKDIEKPLSIVQIFQENKIAVIGIFICNALMLLFGYLQEIQLLSIVTSSILGYLSLMGSFGILYKEFVLKVPNKQGLFYFMFSVWSLYGVAAMLPTIPKNIAYNVLDILAKNFYGVFLSYIMLQKSTENIRVIE